MPFNLRQDAIILVNFPHAVFSAVGERGVPGYPGSEGSLGFPGRKGEPGAAGVIGQPGGRGLPGIDGRPGLVGQKGDRGFRGNVGGPGILLPRWEVIVSLCLSVDTYGGGGYPGQVQPAGEGGWGVPPAGGLPHLRYPPPPVRPGWRGTPCWGVSHLGYPLST